MPQSPQSPPKVSFLNLSDLIPSPTNARTHSPEQIKQIAASIERFGFTQPILADGLNIIAGHGRCAAVFEIYARSGAIRLPSGAPVPPGKVPVIDVSGWSEDDRRAYMLADNAIALAAGWDEELLKSELGALSAANFDMSLLGFEMTEIDRLLGKREGATDPDDVPPVPEEPVSQLGDIWLLGDHRIICGSSTDPGDVAAVAAGAKIDIVCSDPPYGISVVKGSSDGGAKAFGKVGGGKQPSRGRVHGPAKNAIIQPGIYAPIIGDETTETAVEHYKLIAEMGVPVIVLWGGNYFANDLPPSRCWLVWDKENTGTFADAELAWTNQDKVVRLLRHQWSGLIKASERGAKRVHPTQKPVALADWVIDTLAPDAEVIFDGFLGSGWTLISAEQRGISCIAMELSPAYIDVAIDRWQAFSGKIAVLEATNKTFPEVMAERQPGKIDDKSDD